jgi:hypothetical protein
MKKVSTVAVLPGILLLARIPEQRGGGGSFLPLNSTWSLFLRLAARYPLPADSTQNVLHVRYQLPSFGSL